MGIGAIIGSVISGLVGAGGNMLNFNQQQQTNRQQMDFQRSMYGRMREDALSDWHMQNEWNHPTQQMQRLKEAGLNPTLVYGKGATAPTQAVRSSQAPTTNITAPRVDTQGINPIMDYANVSQIEAKTQLDLAKARNEDVRSIILGIDASRGERQDKLEESLFDINLEAADAALANTRAQTETEIQRKLNLETERKKTEADTQYVLDKNQREEIANTTNIAYTMKKIMHEEAKTAKTQLERQQIKKALEKTDVEIQILKFDAMLQKEGIPRSTPWYGKFLMDAVVKDKKNANTILTPNGRIKVDKNNMDSTGRYWLNPPKKQWWNKTPRENNETFRY